MLFILCSGECQVPDLKLERTKSQRAGFPGLLTGTNSSPIRNVRYFGPALYMLIVDLAENLRRRKLLPYLLNEMGRQKIVGRDGRARVL